MYLFTLPYIFKIRLIMGIYMLKICYFFPPQDVKFVCSVESKPAIVYNINVMLCIL